MDFARLIPLTSKAPLLGFHSCFSVVQNLCNGRTGLHVLQPGVENGEVGLKVDPVCKKWNNEIPRHERCIGIAELVANEEFFILENAVEDAGDATDIIDVALNSARERL